MAISKNSNKKRKIVTKLRFVSLIAEIKIRQYIVGLLNKHDSCIAIKSKTDDTE